MILIGLAVGIAIFIVGISIWNDGYEFEYRKAYRNKKIAVARFGEWILKLFK